jgi:hypothetical protein
MLNINNYIEAWKKLRYNMLINICVKKGKLEYKNKVGLKKHQKRYFFKLTEYFLIKLPDNYKKSMINLISHKSFISILFYLKIRIVLCHFKKKLEN